MRWFVHLALLALTLGVICKSAPAQSRISSESRLGTEKTEKTDRDNVIQREQWFRRGRQGVQGRSAAALRYDAYQQMVARRKARNSSRETIQSATHTAGGLFTTSQT
jgi:hypothetical protein